MRRLEMQLHAKNRIWLGEDLYAWQVARLLGAIGEDVSAALADPADHPDFGNGYEPGQLDDMAQVDVLLARLRARLVR